MDIRSKKSRSRKMKTTMVRLGAYLLVILAVSAASAQVIEYEKDGIKHQTLTRNGVTVMFAVGKAHVKEYAMIQVSISNGSDIYSNINPEDSSALTSAPTVSVVRAANAVDIVVRQLLEHGNIGGRAKAGACL